MAIITSMQGVIQINRLGGSSYGFFRTDPWSGCGSHSTSSRRVFSRIVAHARPGAAHDLALIGGLLPGDELEQGRFSASVWPDEGDALSVIAANPHVLVERLSAEGHTQVANVEDIYGVR